MSKVIQREKDKKKGKTRMVEPKQNLLVTTQPQRVPDLWVSWANLEKKNIIHNYLYFLLVIHIR